jgi:uncharacterized protein (TIGR01589 family)
MDPNGVNGTASIAEGRQESSLPRQDDSHQENTKPSLSRPETEEHKDLALGTATTAAAAAGNANGHKPKVENGVSTEDIQLVQNLIERCLQLYMTREEVINVLKTQATIDPGFTQLVWGKLEEQNHEFFRCYYTRLKLKAQIIMFNHLLEQQVSVVQRMQRGWNGSAAGNGSSATASGIPLFQGSSYAAKLDDDVSDNHPPQGTRSGRDSGLGMQDGPGQLGIASPLFPSLHHVGSEHDLSHGELGFLPTSSPLHISGSNFPGNDFHFPRNFSLSDLGGLDGNLDGDGSRSPLSLAGRPDMDAAAHD